MRIISHSTLTISTCALALLSQISCVHSYFGVFNKKGGYPINTPAQRYVDANQKKHGLSNIYWGGGNGDQLSLARVTWNKQDAFMKCDVAAYGSDPSNIDMPEIDAFEALEEAKEKLKGAYAIGRQNVINPLHQFGFFDSNNGNRYYCHLYSYIDGVLLEDYFKERTISQAFTTASEILPEVIKGAIYLYNAGIIHGDLFPKNIMIQKNFLGRITGVRIIDFDSASVFDKEQGWQPVTPSNREHLSPNPIQRYASCNWLRTGIIGFIDVFVNPDKIENPFSPTYRITEQAARGYLNGLKQKRLYTQLEVGNVNAAVPAILRLIQAYFTMWHDNFPCSSPIRVLMKRQPRIGTQNRPTSPSF